MHSDSGRSDSIWMATAPLEVPEPLTNHLTVDVAVIGAGIAGLTTAYLLASEGRGVVVLDDGPIGGGETSRTSAHLSNALDDRYELLERLHGAQGARLAAQSHAAAIDRIEQIAARERIDCDFARIDGYLVVPPGESTDVLDAEFEAARRAGLAVERIDRPPFPSYDFGEALRFPNQARFHALHYLNGLAAAVRRHGGQIYGAHVARIRTGRTAQLGTREGPIVSARTLVVATNSPINDRVTIHTKQAAYRTYVLALPIAAGAAPDALLWDTPDPYHYVRLCKSRPDWPNGFAGHDWLIVGGEDHKTGQNDDFEAPFARLERWARERFTIEKAEPLRWSGQVLEPIDGLAFIGHNPTRGKNVFVATGDSGNGLTHGTIAGLLLTDLIQGRHSPWQELYDPARRTLRAAKDFGRENLNVAAHYADWVKPGDVKAARYLKRGHGAVFREGLRKVAAFRDDDGTLYQHSAVCTHLGCVVAWNDAERTWDCPCHGSRFDKYDGHPLNGPAVAPLGDAGEAPRPTEKKSRRAPPRRSERARRGARPQ
jgi:glycine/D-amino acid oxidase-like deaminating enzyme/nitrite reductase/ring-hydroxylating ferredoxin subunit